MELEKLLQDLCNVDANITSFDISRCYTSGALKQIEISIYYDLPFGATTPNSYYTFATEQEAIKGISALITLKQNAA